MGYERSAKVFQLVLVLFVILMLVLVAIEGIYFLPLFNLLLFGILSAGVLFFYYESWNMDNRWRLISISVLIIVLSYLSKIVTFTVLRGVDFALVDFIFVYWEFLWITLGHLYYIRLIRPVPQS